MNNNDILIRVRYAFHFKNAEMAKIFKLGGTAVSVPKIVNLLKKEEEEDFYECEDELLDVFLDGFIIFKRGPADPSRPAPPKPPQLSNNIILRRIRIALALKDIDIVEIMALAEVKVSKSEVNALFQRESHKNYKPCQTQFMRNFLKGLSLKFRPI